MAILFLIVTTSRVLIAFINKVGAWGCYCGEGSNTHVRTRWFKFARGLSEQFWIDVLLDVLTMPAFGAGIWQVLTVFAQ